MDVLYFYWFSWIWWVLLTFFMGKTKERTYLSALILLLLIFSTTFISFEIWEVNVAYLVLFTSSFIPYKNQTNYMISWIYTLIIALFYGGFHLFALYDPVWIIGDYLWLLSACMFLITCVVVTPHRARQWHFINGACVGEALLSIMLGKIGIKPEVGNEAFLSLIAAVTLALFLWESMKKAFYYISFVRLKERPSSFFKKG
ncbi:hypothetical protein L1I79_38685 [Strepomyces sp. STD 3.1]|nr:hypothetical protein [Streptomyces sp. STD 3.1]